MNPKLNTYPELLEFAQDHLGNIRCAEFRGWNHAESFVWRLKPKKGDAAYLKAHKQVRKFRQELNAYLNWVSKVETDAPVLLAYKPEGQKALLLSELKGNIVDTITLSPKQEVLIYQQAGAFLRQYHEIPFDDTDIPVTEALMNRTQAWALRAKNKMNDTEIDWVKARVLETLPILKSYKRVPCHRDYTSRNWLVDCDLKLRIIDFEHSRSDLKFLDFERMWGEHWLERPNLEVAFWEGYGRTLSSEEKGLLERLAALGAMSSVAWAKEHKDSVFEVHARKVLKRLMKGR